MHPHIGYVQTVHAMGVTCKTFERGPKDMVFCKGPVQMARSRIAAQTIEQHYDFVLMHDDDLAVDPVGAMGNPLDVWHELFDVNPDVGVIGAVYLRERPLSPTVCMPHPEFPEELCHVVAGFPFAPLEVAALATGFMMIRRQVFEALADDQDMFRFTARKNRWGGISQRGEDYDFCVRAREAGWKVLADPRFTTTHMKDQGPLVFNWHDWEAGWKDGAPGVAERADELRGHLGNGPRVIEIRGMAAIDHTPLLMDPKVQKKAA